MQLFISLNLDREYIRRVLPTERQIEDLGMHSGSSRVRRAVFFHPDRRLLDRNPSRSRPVGKKVGILIPIPSGLGPGSGQPRRTLVSSMNSDTRIGL